ncbi:CrcB family protein [Streptomyces solicathayae]|uniref:Fluoride-specific ion channel FluC n=1 Tax=Streptomyces solicathayae TaxID=3081768 RepID=A0ABZ0LXP9_9ACTN|nr:CrcB family protein [Streptomyces sp. HUAS YS2]WOX24293.1 CrcB family protein [Streptomyces sp. HUAS YS2]
MLSRAQLPVVGVVAVGGALGAAARYGAALAWPTRAGAFPWTTFGVNVLGCALIGVLMVAVTETAAPPHPLVRPFLGTGVLGGFTTFSTYTLDTRRLLETGDAVRAMAYMGATAAVALAAVWAATTATRGVRAARGARVRRAR